MTPRTLNLAWRIGLTVLLLALLVLLNLVRGVPQAGAQSSSDPLVLAFYYLWFDENSWSYDRLSDLPAQTYSSSDRGAMGRHIDQARSAGIDAFVAAWYGPGGGNPTEGNLAALLEEANARGFKVGILFETNSPFLGGSGDVVAALQHALAAHAAQPAFLRVDGRPVLFFWQTQMYGVETWRSIRAQADPNHAALWIADGVDTSYLSVFDGHHLYSNTWNPPANLESTNAKFAARVESARQSSGAPKFWVATVMPGYNDVKVRPGSGFAQDREGGAYYGRSWAAATASRPNWIVITSFNEWPEGSYIEPSAAYGDAYLGLTAAYAGQFKAGGGVPMAPLPPVAAAAPPAAPLVEPDTPTLFVQTPLLNVRSGPGTEFPVVERAGQGAALALTGRSAAAPAWWQVEIDGQAGWVSGELVRAAGPLEQVPEVSVSAALPVAASAADALPAAASSAAAPPVGGWRPVLSPRP